MSVSVLGRASREASIVPQIDPWVFWLAIYWLVLWGAFLEWYRREMKKGRPPMGKMEAFFTLLFIGFLLPASMIYAIVKAIAKTKR